MAVRYASVRIWLRPRTGVKNPRTGAVGAVTPTVRPASVPVTWHFRMPARCRRLPRHWARVSWMHVPIDRAIDEFLCLVGADNPVTSRDLGVFTDQAAEPFSPQYGRDIRAYRGADASVRRADLLQLLMRPMRVVVIYVLAEDRLEMPLAGDQHPVQALAASAAHPALRDRVRPRRLDRRLDDPHADRGEHRIESSGELRIPVTDQEFQAVSMVL